MGVEIHLGATVTNMDESGVEITKQDGSTERIPAATKVWAAGTRAAGLGTIVAGAAGAENDKAGRVVVNADCSLPTHPEVFVVGDLMAHRDDLPGVAEVAMQSGIHASHSIVRRLEGKPTKPFHYRDLGTLAVISRFTAVAKIGPLRVGGFVGWLLLARGAHHLPHRIQEPVRGADPLADQLRRARTLRAGAHRALGRPDEAAQRQLPRVRGRNRTTKTGGSTHAHQRHAH